MHTQPDSAVSIHPDHSSKYLLAFSGWRLGTCCIMECADNRCPAHTLVNTRDNPQMVLYRKTSGLSLKSELPVDAWAGCMTDRQTERDQRVKGGRESE